jgi:hypothetical protein
MSFVSPRGVLFFGFFIKITTENGITYAATYIATIEYKYERASL